MKKPSACFSVLGVAGSSLGGTSYPNTCQRSPKVSALIESALAWFIAPLWATKKIYILVLATFSYCYPRVQKLKVGAPKSAVLSYISYSQRLNRKAVQTNHTLSKSFFFAVKKLEERKNLPRLSLYRSHIFHIRPL